MRSCHIINTDDVDLNSIIRIETDRLFIDVMGLDCIDAAYARDYQKLGSLGYIAEKNWPSDEYHEALPLFREMVVNSGAHGFGSWIILDKSTMEVVGAIGFIGGPDESGAVEIGFGINPDRRCRGFCAESIEAIAEWAFSIPAVTRITAHCDDENSASKKVLEKTGFMLQGMEDGLCLWCRVKPS